MIARNAKIAIIGRDDELPHPLLCLAETLEARCEVMFFQILAILGNHGNYGNFSVANSL
jgi:hypothetical protein